MVTPINWDPTDTVPTGPEQGYTVEAIARSGSNIVARKSVNGATSLHISHPRLWSPDDPNEPAKELCSSSDGSRPGHTAVARLCAVQE